MSQVFSDCNSLETCGRQDFAAALGTNDSLSETNFNDIITVNEDFSSYKIIHHADRHVLSNEIRK